MNNNNYAHFKKLLQVKETELQAESTRLESEARISGEAEVRDAIDDATTSAITSESLQEGALLSSMLVQVQEALRRIDDGSYGACIACGRPIQPARLEAVPWTP